MLRNGYYGSVAQTSSANGGQSNLTDNQNPNTAWLPVIVVSLNFRLLRKFQSILDFYAKVTNRAFQFGVPQKQLHCTDVFGSTIDKGRFGPAYRVGTIGRWIKSYFLNPRIQYACVLPCPQVG